ncbi:MAG TPA: 2-oxoglutarate and iron-dependent oxygenase domain-containing protein [Rhizomicrobium sp.]
MTSQLPVIDVAPLFGGDPASRARTAGAIGAACRTHGFFYASGHGIAAALLERLDEAAREFFALPQAEKNEIAMVHGGPAWRGYFPVGGELTSGEPDNKEGLYFGGELGADDPRVRRGLPLHGANLFPARPRRLRPAVNAYMAAATETAQAVLEGIALSLDLDAGYFRRHYTTDPTVLFRIFQYPASDAADARWGVGEHTDYGLLTLLAQDDRGGLEVNTRDGWIDAPPLQGTLVCNIGDMLDRLTGGAYKSTPHRAKNVSGRGRLSFPFFFDPGFDAEIRPLPARDTVIDDWRARWDRASVHDFTGTYGDYLLGKVSKVFPDLSRDVIA